MHPEAEAELILEEGVDIEPSPVSSFAFITSFGEQSFSAAVVPDGSSQLVLNQPSIVRLRFLVEEAVSILKPNAAFTFFEQGRRGKGCIINHLL